MDNDLLWNKQTSKLKYYLKKIYTLWPTLVENVLEVEYTSKHGHNDSVNIRMFRPYPAHR